MPALRQNKRLILVTGHRRENLAGGLARVADGLARLADRGDVEIVFPLHLNPEVRRAAIPRLSNRPGIHLTEPLDYLPFVQLMRRSAIIITDSGGVQEEAPSLGKPVIVTRDTTERAEAVAAGTAELVGTDPDRLFTRASRLLDDEALYARRAVPHRRSATARRRPASLRLCCMHSVRRIAVLGLGYIGLPTAAAFADQGVACSGWIPIRACWIGFATGRVICWSRRWALWCGGRWGRGGWWWMVR